MAKKEGLRRRISHFLSRSELNLKELQQRRETEGDGPRLPGATDPQDGGGWGKRKTSLQKKRASEGASEEGVRSASVKHAIEPSNSPSSQKLASKAHALSHSEPDLWRNGLLRKFGSLTWWKRRRSRLELSEHPGHPASNPCPLGRLQRPAVGSDVDMRSRPDFYPDGNQCGKQERPEPSPLLSETDSIGTSPVPSTSFDSLLCWGDGSSWEGSFSMSNSPCFATVTEMKGEALKCASVQEETSKAPQPVSEWAESVFDGCLAIGSSHPTVTGELENLSFRSSLGESISEHISRAEEPKTDTSSPHEGRPPEGADSALAAKISSAKNSSRIRYEIMITMTKEEEEDERAAADLTAGCAERGMPCHPPGQGTLSLGVAELEERDKRRHQEPARPVPQLSASKEFQNCRGLRGVGTCKARRPILTPASESSAALQWGLKASPGEGEEGQSETDRRHSRDDALVEGTGIVAAGSPANSFSESSGISLAAGSKESQPIGAFDIGRGLFHAQHSMEKVISNSRSSQSRSEGSAVSTSFRWKKSAPDLLKEEPKPPLGKVLAMTQMIERGGARTRTRTRGNSPSRVSMLLEAWEKGLVGTDAAGPSSSADIRHSHSSLPTRRVLSSKDAPRPLFPENTGLSLSPASIRRSLSPSDRQRSVFLAETRQSHSPAHTKRSLSPAETRHCFSPAETRHCFSPAETRRSRSPAETRCSFSPVETRRSFSPAETRRSFSPAEARRSRSPAETRCSFSPAETRRSRSPAETRRSFSPAETRHSFSPAETRRSRSLGETRRSFSPAETRRSRSPADIKRSPSPASTWHSFSTAEIRHSFSPVETRRCHSLAKNSPPADSRHSFSAVEMRRPHSPASNKPPCFQADPQCSSFSTGSQHSSSSIESCLSSFSADDHGSPSPVNIQHSSSLPVDKCPYSVADIRRLYCSADTGCPSSPTNTKHPISSAEPRRPSSPADTKHPSSSAEPRHPFPFPENRLSSSPADTRHSSPPTDSRSFSPTSDERCSHSLSPQKGFTAHGPVFAQVYSPVSKSKSLGGTQMPDADSTAVAGSQEEHSCSDATNTPLATELQTASHISSPDGSQKDNPPPVPISTRAIESQRESHMSNGAVSDTVAGSLRESDQPIAIILRSQTENYQSQSVSPSLFCGSPEGNCTPSATSVNPSSEPCVLSPFPRAVSSSTVAKSQTEWYVPKSDSRAVFKSGRQVIIPQAGTTTVYRAGQGISMSSSEAEGPSNAQQGRSLVLNSGSNLPPEENCQSQSDLPDGESPKGSPASLPDGACNCSTAGSEQESCMTQSRNASASDAQRQRCKRLPNPALTSNGDATTLWERVSPFSTSKKGCNPHTVPLFQRHSNLFTASRSERKQSIPDLGGPIANRSEQETAGETRVFGTSTGSTETAPSDQTATELSEKQSNPIKDAPVLTLESTIPLTEMNSSPELLSQKTGSSSRMAEEEPEEVVDMELFVDTLRNMEPPELRKPLKLLPRPLLPSTFTKHTPLPPIHEDHISPKSKLPLPAAQGELFAFTEEGTAQGAKDAQEEDAGLAEAEVEEIENPYPSKEERLQENSQTRESFPWENKTFKTEEEIGSFLGKLQQGPVVPTAQIIAPEAIANYSNLIRANILKGLSLLSGFSEKQAVENKPYSRLDNSLLYSKFISPEKSQLKASEKRKEEGCSHTLLFSAVQKVNRECQTSPNGLEMKTFEHLSSELLRSGLHADPVSWVPGANSNSSRVPLLSREADSLPQSETQQEEKKLSEKVNVRPGKIVLYFESGFGGQKREIWGDIIDATSWELSHTISIRVVRGGWVIYEKPRFQGRKCVLAEGDVEISNPWRTSHKEGAAVENGPFHIGSLKRVVQDYKIPEISLFTEENGEGIKWKFTDSSEDTQIHSLPLKAASIIVHSGLWLVYSKPFFDDDPYVLEPGGYPTLQAWGAKDPTICSMHPIKMGCPVVEKPGEPKALIYEQPHFQGHSWEVSRDIYNLKKPENNQDSKMSTAGSLKIAGGCWIGYEKEGFRGHQYLLEEGEYYDWTQWGGYNEDLVSLRLIRTDFLDPALVLFEAMDFEEGPSVELSEALPDVELACYGTTTQSIHVLSGVWVAYEGKNYSGEQYILEKGVYRSCEDWGASNCQISSVQPILQVGEHSLHFVSQIQLFSDPDFLGNSVSFKEDQASLPENFIPRSCRVNGGSWILFDCPQFDGDQHILSEGEYPTLTSMGCLFTTAIRSLKKVPIFFSEPSIFLHGLECFEGKEIELNSEVRSLQAEGFNNHVLSVRVKGGIWVLCEHSDFRGRQWLLDCIEITNWLTYSGLQHVGSLYPIRQRRIYFRLKNEELKSFLSVPDDAEDMKAGRVLVSELNDKSSSIWYYEEGLMKNQVAPNMSLQVIGPAGKGSKVVLWSESRMPCQTWRVDSLGRICSQMFEHKVLDVKGGRTYDRDHAILWDSSEARPTQIWAVQVL